MAYQYYNGYQNPYVQYQQPMMQPMYQYPQMYQQQTQVQQPYPQQVSQTASQPQISGQMVDSVDVVKAKDVDLSGNPVFYPNVNGNEIYKKQLLVDGTSKIFVYKLDECQDKQIVNKSVSYDDITAMINKMKTDIISEMKALIG